MIGFWRHASHTGRAQAIGRSHLAARLGGPGRAQAIGWSHLGARLGGRQGTGHRLVTPRRSAGRTRQGTGGGRELKSSKNQGFSILTNYKLGLGKATLNFVRAPFTTHCLHFLIRCLNLDLMLLLLAPPAAPASESSLFSSTSAWTNSQEEPFPSFSALPTLTSVSA